MIDNNDAAHISRINGRSNLVGSRPLAYNATAFQHRNGLISSVFHVKPIYYLSKNNVWRPLSEIALYYGNHRIVLDASKAWDRCSFSFLQWLSKRQRLLGCELEYAFAYGPYVGVPMHEYATMASLTAYPDPNTETTSCDGEIYHDAAGWATARDAAAGTSAVASTDTLDVTCAENGGSYIFERAFTLFDTSALGGGASVSAATVSLYGVGTTVNGDNDGADYLAALASTPASNTNITTADYDQIGTTEGSDQIDIGSWATSAYNDFTLNATGIGWVDVSGITKLGWREGHDITNATIATNYASRNEVQFSAADEEGTSQDPKLVVTYSVGEAGPMGMF